MLHAYALHARLVLDLELETVMLMLFSGPHCVLLLFCGQATGLFRAPMAKCVHSCAERAVWEALLTVCATHDLTHASLSCAGALGIHCDTPLVQQAVTRPHQCACGHVHSIACCAVGSRCRPRAGSCSAMTAVTAPSCAHAQTSQHLFQALCRYKGTDGQHTAGHT